jgi:hypothetical protein
MKIKDLLTKIALCIVPVALFIISNRLRKSTGQMDSNYPIAFISILNVSMTCVYIFTKRNEYLNGGDKLKFLGRRIDLLFIISQVCLGIILYLFSIKFGGVISLSEVYIFIAMMLYGNYYSLTPMPPTNLSMYFEDEDIWRKVSAFRGKFLFTIGIIGLLSVLYYSPNGLGIEYMYFALAIMAIIFIITYFYAKQQYNQKFNR